MKSSGGVEKQRIQSLCPTMPVFTILLCPAVSQGGGGGVLCLTAALFTSVRAYFFLQTKLVHVQKWHLVCWSKLLPPGFLWVVKLPEKPDIYCKKRYSSKSCKIWDQKLLAFQDVSKCQDIALVLQYMTHYTVTGENIFILKDVMLNISFHIKPHVRHVLCQ